MSSFSAFTATTAYANMLPANPSRLGVIIKSKKTNTDTVFFKADSSTGTGTTASLMPLEPGESFYLTAEFGQIRAAVWSATIGIISNTGSQDIRYIEFTP